MTKWEYLILICDSRLEVDRVNGDSTEADIATGNTGLLFRDKRRPYLHEYLPDLGKQGWEVCGTSPYSTGIDGNILSVQIILKRPLEE